MADYATTSYTGDASTTAFVIGFSYLLTSHLTVSVGGTVQTIDTHYTIDTSTQTINFVSAPASAASIVFARTTPLADADRTVIFSNGSALTATQLNDAVLQLLYVSQEFDDYKTTLTALNALFATWQSLLDDPQTIPWTNAAGAAGHLDVLLSTDSWANSDTQIATTQAVTDQLGGIGTGDMLSTNNLSDVGSAATSRTNLGVVIGTDVQAWDAALDDIAGLTQATDKIPYFDSATTASLLTLNPSTSLLSNSDTEIPTTAQVSNISAGSSSAAGSAHMPTPYLRAYHGGTFDPFAGSGGEIVLRFAFDTINSGTNTLWQTATTPTTSSAVVNVWYDGANERIHINHGFSSTDYQARWDVSLAADTFYWVRIKYDNTSLSNDAECYVDGLQLTRTDVLTPGGAPTSMSNGYSTVCGNTANSVPFNGWIQRCILFNTILDQRYTDLRSGGSVSVDEQTNVLYDLDFSVGVGHQFPCRSNSDTIMTQLNTEPIHSNPRDTGVLRALSFTSSASFGQYMTGVTGTNDVLPTSTDYYIEDIWAYSAGTPTLTLGDNSGAAATLVASVALSAATWTKLTLLKNTVTDDDIYCDFTASGAVTNFVVKYTLLRK